MKIFLNIDPKKIQESIITNPKIIDEIDEISNSIDANIKLDVRIPNDVLDSFKIKDSLNPDIWINGKLNPNVKNKLTRIALGFFKDLNLPKKTQIKDIILTGSLANFNWSKFSDIDLHLVIDFNQFDAEPSFIDDYFYSQKALWNQEHNIEIYNYPVEIYVQDVNAKLIATAVYSILKDKWIKKPTREDFQLDKSAIKNKADSIINKLRDIKLDYKDKNYQSVVDKVTILKDKIKQMRNAGLEKGGEFSLENLTFKVLRRTNFMDVLDSFKAKAYDSLMSLSETINENLIDEGEILDNTSFKYKRVDEDNIVIKAIYNNLEIGSITCEQMSNAYWYFEDEISEEQYNQLFPDDEFILIPNLEVKLDKYKGEGIGRELMKRAIAKAKQLGFNQIALNASPMGSKGLDINSLVNFYESFGFKTFLNQGTNSLMSLNLNHSQINEADRFFNKDGVILIKGAPLKDGNKRLFITTINDKLELNRLNKTNQPSQPSKMVILGNPVFLLQIVDGKLIAKKINWQSEQSQLNYLGLNKYSVTLNNNKTPLHWQSLKYNNIQQAIAALSNSILNIPQIRWVG